MRTRIRSIGGSTFDFLDNADGPRKRRKETLINGVNCQPHLIGVTLRCLLQGSRIVFFYVIALVLPSVSELRAAPAGLSEAVTINQQPRIKPDYRDLVIPPN